MKTFELLVSLFLSAQDHAPPTTRPVFPGHEETLEQTTGRYAEIAADIVRIVGEQPPPDGMSRADGAALLLGMAIGESGLSADVDSGRCYRGKGWEARCDHGRARSIWQTWEQCSTRLECGRIAYRLLRRSLAACRALPAEHRLSGYGSGRCQPLDGAAKRWGTVQAVRSSMWRHMVTVGENDSAVEPTAPSS